VSLHLDRERVRSNNKAVIDAFAGIVMLAARSLEVSCPNNPCTAGRDEFFALGCCG
jgi:hypothetical protein